MNLKERISVDTKQALKSGDKQRVSVLRMVTSKILEKEVELRTKKGRDYKLDDDETIEVITSYAKQRRQSIDSYRDAGRQDLAGNEEKELLLLQEYLPKQLSEAEIEGFVDEAIAETGATSIKDLGSVMRALMPKVKGAADGKVVNQIVRTKLGA